MSAVTDRYTATGDEAGTAPGDRRFRPDVQGLRAVAILLVVLFHAGIPGISGGYVGVDVFFVISGFVITGLLLREREVGRRTSFLNFYSRRARRIIPAASVVIIVTVIAAFHYLGSLTGHETAIDGQWAAVFLANFHFAASQTNYLASQRPPSALQNYWSLAVEEQFYIVYPTVFLVAASLVTRISLRVRLAILLVTVIVASYAFSIVFTSANPSSAFFSPLTRAWELALGGLIAVGSDRSPALASVARRIPLLARARRDRDGERHPDVRQRVSGCPRGDTRGRGRFDHRGRYFPAGLGCRIPAAAEAVSATGTHLLFALSLALADSHHCNPESWRDEPARLGQRCLASGCDSGGNSHVPTH